MVNGPGFPELFTPRQSLQAGCLLDPGHSCQLSSLLPVKYIFCFAGKTRGWINYQSFHRQFVTGRNRTELGYSRISSDEAG